MLIWTPFRAGRRPLALFDQFAAVGTVGALGAYSVGADGPGLWLSGGLGLVFGMLTYFAANHLINRVHPVRPAVGGIAILLALIGCVTSTSLGFYTGQWLLNA